MTNWQGVWRSNPQAPQESVALGARSAGRAEAGPGWVIPCGTVPFVNAFWTVSGWGRLFLGQSEFRVAAGDLFVYVPGQFVRGRAGAAGWRYRWFTVDGPLALEVLAALGLSAPWPKPGGRCPVELFDELEAEIANVAGGAEQRAGATLFEILSLAARRVGGGGSAACSGVVEQCRDRIDAGFTDPFLDISGIAAGLRVHRSRLTRLFREQIGLPPGVYLQRLRLRHALKLLRETDLSIKEVSFASGFRDPSYFSRRIRQVTGQTPAAFRVGL